MNLRKRSTHNTISFLNTENEEVTEIEKKAETEEEILNRVAEEQKSKRLSHKDNGLLNAHSVASTGRSSEEQFDGNKKFIKSETSNSIWGNKEIKETEVVEEGQSDRITKLLELKRRKKEADKKRMETIPKLGKQVIFPEQKQTHGFKQNLGGIGLFDNNDFNNVPEKTDGEKLVEENIKKSNQKDNSWRENNKSLNTNEVYNSLVESLKKVKNK